MAIEVVERWSSRKRVHGTRQSAQIGYLVIGTDDDTEAKNELISQVPVSWDGLPFDDCDVNQMSDDSFECVAKYLDQESKDQKEQEKQVKELQQPEDESEFAFEIGASSEHITHSRETRWSAAPEGEPAPPDLKRAIGVVIEGRKLSINGVDVDGGSFKFSLKKVFNPESITPSYINFLYRLRRQCNGSTWKGFALGEVRFMGASGKKRKDGKFEITFHFEARPTFDGTEPIAGVYGLIKRGWEYAWVLTGPGLDDGSGWIVPKVLGVYIEEIYAADGDYAAIGVGS